MATKKKWIQKATAKMKKKGTVGTFKKAAKKAGESTSEFAEQVLKSPKATPAMKKKANFAKNVAKKKKGK